MLSCGHITPYDSYTLTCQLSRKHLMIPSIINVNQKPLLVKMSGCYISAYSRKVKWKEKESKKQR